MFPHPQLVRLDKPPCCTTELLSGSVIRESQEIERHRELPITLRVNHESRIETLRYYSVIDHDRYDDEMRAYRWPHNKTEAEHASNVQKPLCFSHNFDSAFILGAAMWEECPSWFDKITKQSPTFLEKVQELEIRPFAWHTQMYQGLMLSKKAELKDHASCYGLPLLRFKGLKKLVLVLTDRFGQGDIPTLNPPHTGYMLQKMEGKEECLRAMNEFLESQKENWGGTIPDVSIVNWTKLSARVVCKD